MKDLDQGPLELREIRGEVAQRERLRSLGEAEVRHVPPEEVEARCRGRVALDVLVTERLERFCTERELQGRVVVHEALHEPRAVRVAVDPESTELAELGPARENATRPLFQAVVRARRGDRFDEPRLKGGERRAVGYRRRRAMSVVVIPEVRVRRRRGGRARALVDERLGGSSELRGRPAVVAHGAPPFTNSRARSASA